MLYSLLLINWWHQLSAYVYIHELRVQSINLSELHFYNGMHFYNGQLYQLSPNTNTYENHVGCLLWDENLIHNIWYSCDACNNVLYLTFYYKKRFYSETWCPETRAIFCNNVFIFNRKNNLKPVIRVTLFRRSWLCIKSLANLFNNLFRYYNQSCALLAPWEGNHQSPVDSYHKRPLALMFYLMYTRTMHYNDAIMGAIASQITSLTLVYSTVYSDADQRKHQSSASLAFVRGIHRGPVNSPQKWPVTRKMFPFDDVVMLSVTMNSHLKGRVMRNFSCSVWTNCWINLPVLWYTITLI